MGRGRVHGWGTGYEDRGFGVGVRGMEGTDGPICHSYAGGGKGRIK